MKIWNFETNSQIARLVGHSKSVNAVALSQNGKIIVSGSLDNTVKVWNFETGCEIVSLIGHQSFINSVAISRDNKRVISGS